MERIAMSQRERDSLEWLKRACDGLVTQRQAAQKMGLTDRWIRELVARMEKDGDRIVVHGLAGRAFNRRIDEKTRAKAMKILRQPEWHDFGPTFASEQLAKRHSIAVSKETVRAWMVAEGMWKSPPTQRWRDSPLASAAELLWRTDAVGHLGPRLAGEPGRTRQASGAYDR
jgi:hypothetical protein